MDWLNQCHFGDCLEVMRGMPDSIVQTCVTSPPYFGLRDYGYDGQIGLEATPDEFIAKLVAVFREVRRMLRDDGTLWVNMGDSYARNGGQQGGGNRELLHLGDSQTRMLKIPTGSGLKEKDLIGIPWMLAFALRADGWYLRQDIIWAKPNPMPESVTDRCTKSHEYIFLLSKSASYYCNMAEIQERCVSSEADLDRATILGRGEQSASAAYLGLPQRDKSGGFPTRGRGGKNAFRGQGHFRDGDNGPANREGRDMQDIGVGYARNKRSVWTVSTKPYKGAHFATFPTDLIEPCILAGAPAGGIVLDPFFGSGTTGQVAQALGRKFIGIELNEAYKPLQDERLRQPSLDLEPA
jgi:DNA modification methylase